MVVVRQRLPSHSVSYKTLTHYTWEVEKRRRKRYNTPTNPKTKNILKILVNCFFSIDPKTNRNSTKISSSTLLVCKIVNTNKVTYLYPTES